MEASYKGQRMLEPLYEKLVWDLVIAKNSWTHPPPNIVINENRKSGYYVTDRMHTASVILFPKNQICYVSKSHH